MTSSRRYGSPPGVFGPEGWDVGGMLLAAFRAGAVDRRAVAAGARGVGRLRGSGEHVPVRGRRGARLRLGRGARVPGRRGPMGARSARGRGGAVARGHPRRICPSRRAARVARTPTRWAAGSRGSTSSSPRRSLAGSGSRSRGATSRAGPRSVTWRTARSTPSWSRPPTWPRGHRRRASRSACTSRSSPRGRRRTIRARRCSIGWDRTTWWPSSARRRRSRGRTTPWAERERRCGSRPTDARHTTRSRPERSRSWPTPEPDAWAAIERRPSLRVAQSIDVGAHDVFVGKGPDARVVAAIDGALARLIRVGRYGLLFAKYFPGTPVPSETGT